MCTLFAFKLQNIRQDNQFIVYLLFCIPELIGFFISKVFNSEAVCDFDTYPYLAKCKQMPELYAHYVIGNDLSHISVKCYSEIRWYVL